MRGDSGPTISVKREYRKCPWWIFGRQSHPQVIKDVTGAFLSRINWIKGNVSNFPLGAAHSSCLFSSYSVTPHCCLFYQRIPASFTQEFCVDILPLHHFLVACVCAIITSWWCWWGWGGGEVMYFIATCGNVSVQTLLIFPASRECEIPVASWAAGADVDAAEFVSRSLMTPPPPHRSKLKTSRTSRTSSAWWPWPGPTPPPSPTCSPNTTSASRRLAATTRLTCKSAC